MPKEKLDELFESISSEILDLEEVRKNRLKELSQVWLFGILISIGAVIIGSLAFPDFGAKFFMLFLMGLAGLGLTFEQHRRVKKKFKFEFKQEIISKLITTYNPSLEYRPQDRISDAVFIGSKMFSRKPHDIVGEDMIVGKYGDTDFKMSELRATYETTDSDGDSTTNEIFKGIFLVADFHKYFHSETIIIPETGWKAVGLNKKKYKGAALIEMEDPIFEKRFRVFTTNDQDARYILSPSMMERICKLQNKFRDDIWISFRGDSMNIAINTSRDFFEHDLNTPLNDKSLVHHHISELKTLLGIIDDLNLNTRIWSKIPIRLLNEDEKEDG